MKLVVRILATLVIIVLIIAILLAIYGDPKERPILSEAIDSGSIEVFVDESYAAILDSVFQMYRQRYDRVELTVHYVNARNAVAHLLGGQTRVAIVGRDKLPDEDSLMALHNVEPYFMFDVAKDALVFFTQVGFPLDTLNDEALLKVFTENKRLRDILPGLAKEPEFVIAHQNSSEYGNFLNLVCRQKPIKREMLLLPCSDSVIRYVRNNPNAIGICYLSQIQGQFFNLLRIGYTNKDGKYIKATKIPHQSFIVMDEYPFITHLRVYLLEDRRNLPFWFGSFIERERPVVNHLKRMRLVPTYAKYRLEDWR